MSKNVERTRQVLIEGMTPEQILELPREEFDALVFTGSPIVFRAGTATALGEFRLMNGRLTIELAQIEGGGEGVLPTLGALARRYALLHNLAGIDWIVHAVHCAKPNLKLRRVLERRGYRVDVEDGVEAYRFSETFDAKANSS